jgi:acyl dehydratase
MAGLWFDELAEGMVIGMSVHNLTMGTTVIASRPDAGIVTFRHKAFNQAGTLVATCDRQAPLRRRPA